MDFAENKLLPADSYDTPEGRRSFFNKLVLGNRFDFYVRNFSVFIRSGLAGIRGKLDAENQIKYSNMNIDIVERCGGKIHIKGLDILRSLNHEPLVITANHMSLLETGLLHAILRPYLDFSFVVKDSLLKVPYFKDILNTLDAVGVSRTNPREDFKVVMKRGTEILKGGRSMIIFPQSTRSIDFNPDDFNTIGIKLANMAKVRVLPLALKTNFVSSGKIIRDLGPINRKEEIFFSVSEPLEITGNGKVEHAKIIEFISSELNKWNSSKQ